MKASLVKSFVLFALFFDWGESQVSALRETENNQTRRNDEINHQATMRKTVRRRVKVHKQTVVTESQRSGKRLRKNRRSD